ARLERAKVNGDPNGRRSDAPVDRSFLDPNARISDFAFGEETAAVFDDMLSRSVPFYDEIQRMLGEIAADFATDGTSVYDLGCSTGTTLSTLDALPQNVHLIGVDASEAMLAKAERNLAGALRHPYSLACQDLNQGALIDNASVVAMCLTLQFVRPLYRERLLRQ